MLWTDAVCQFMQAGTCDCPVHLCVQLGHDLVFISVVSFIWCLLSCCHRFTSLCLCLSVSVYLCLSLQQHPVCSHTSLLIIKLPDDIPIEGRSQNLDTAAHIDKVDRVGGLCPKKQSSDERFSDQRNGGRFRQRWHLFSHLSSATKLSKLATVFSVLPAQAVEGGIPVRSGKVSKASSRAETNEDVWGSPAPVPTYLYGAITESILHPSGLVLRTKRKQTNLTKLVNTAVLTSVNNNINSVTAL